MSIYKFIPNISCICRWKYSVSIISTTKETKRKTKSSLPNSLAKLTIQLWLCRDVLKFEERRLSPVASSEEVTRIDAHGDTLVSVHFVRVGGGSYLPSCMMSGGGGTPNKRSLPLVLQDVPLCLQEVSLCFTRRVHFDKMARTLDSKPCITFIETKHLYNQTCSVSESMYHNITSTSAQLYLWRGACL